MTTLNRNNSNWSAEERRKINENWDALETLANSTANGNNGLKSEVEQLKVEVSDGTRRSVDASQRSNQAQVAANQSLSLANNASNRSNAALTLANEANRKAEYTQEQLDSIVTDGDSNAEVVQARSSYDNLRQRLDSDNQMINEFVNSRIDIVNSENSRLQNEKADKSELISLDERKRDKGELIKASELDTTSEAGKIGIENLRQSVINAISGNAPVNAEILDNSVTLDSVSFFRPFNRNLFNKLTTNVNTSVSSSNGNLATDNFYSTTDYIPVIPGNIYNLTESRNVAYYGANRNFISGLVGGWSDNQPAGEKHRLTVPNNPDIKFMRASYQTTRVDSFVVFDGPVRPSEYIPYGEFQVRVESPQLADAIKDVSSDLELKENSQKVSVLESFSENLINLANPNTFSNGRAIDNTNGASVSNAGFVHTDYIAVVPGEQIRITRTDNYAFYNANRTFLSGVQGGWTQAPITVPNGAFFIRASFVIGAANKMVVRGSIIPPQFIPYDSEENRTLSFTSESWRTRFQNLFANNTNRLSGLKWNVLGDSITFGLNANGQPYHVWIANRNGLTVRNYGISMSSVSDMNPNFENLPPADFTPMVFRYADMDNDADVITVMAGTNDIVHFAPLGQFGDTGTHTFYGALDTMIVGLINKYPDKSIGYILPPFGSPSRLDTDRNEQFIKAIKEVCKYYAIPVLDLYTGNQLGGRVQARKNILIPDGLHPSSRGHEKLSYAIEQFLLSIV